MNVVFREPTSFFFTKFVNCLAGQDEYYVLNLSYYGVQCGENDSEEGSDEDLENDDEMDPEVSKLRNNINGITIYNNVV